MLRKFKQMRNKKGFTLIELIVVLAVLAIIMAIAVPRFGGVREQAKVDSDMATLVSIAKLAEFEYVRGNSAFDGTPEKVTALIIANFGESAVGVPKALFQSDDLVGKEDSLTVTFTDGFVSKINDGEIDYTYSEGKFTPPSV